jgi:hypothetical protein
MMTSEGINCLGLFVEGTDATDYQSLSAIMTLKVEVSTIKNWMV